MIADAVACAGGRIDVPRIALAASSAVAAAAVVVVAVVAAGFHVAWSRYSWE